MRPLLTFAALLLTTATLGAGVASAAADTEIDQYRRYAVVRQQLLSCSLDRSYHHLGRTGRRRCVRLRKLYVLWSQPGESGGYHVHCRTRTCPPTPIDEPDARSPIPAGANVFR